MKKKLKIVLLIGLIFLFTLIPVSHADSEIKRSHSINLSLIFSGSTAICKAQAMGVSNAVLRAELWQGNTRLITWQAAGDNEIYLEKIRSVIRRKTYTLKVYLIVNGSVIDQKFVTSSCP